MRRQIALPFLCLVACSEATAPALPPGARALAPPPVYRRWWMMAESCAARTGSFDAVRWYVVAGADSILLEGQGVGGYYTAAGHRIVLAEGASLSGPLVRHEMLHALLGAGGHPRAEFLGRCGGVVACIEQCLRDAGPAPPADPAASRVSPSALAVGVSVDPAAPSAAQDGGWFAVTVTARNPAAHAVVVELPPPGDDGPSVGFSFRLDRPDGGVLQNDRVLDPSLARFGPGETKRQVYDFRVGARLGWGEVPTGTYRVSGAYSDHWTAAQDSLVVSP